MDQSNPTAVRKLDWTPELASKYWSVVYQADLPQAARDRLIARHIVAVLAARHPPPARVVICGDRDPAWAETLLFAGYDTARIDTGPLLGGEPQAHQTHPRWLGEVDPAQCQADVLFVPDVLARIDDKDWDRLFHILRNTILPDGLLFTFTPNGEVVAQAEAICPLTGVRFHPAQRVRGFDRITLAEVLEKYGFSSEAIFEIEPNERGFSSRRDLPEVFATQAHTHFGSGELLVAFARVGTTKVPEAASADIFPSQRNDLDRTALQWLSSIRLANRTPVSVTPKAVEWNDGRLASFWSWVAASPLNDQSFGLVEGTALVAAARAWLTPGGRHLDIGAGEGHLAQILIEAGFPTAVMEAAPARLNRFKAKFSGNAGFLGVYEPSGQRNGGFDAVLATEVIEHVLPGALPEFFSTIDRALRPGGRLLFTTPNREDLKQSSIYSPLGDVIFHRWQHVQSFDRASLAQLAEKFGFVAESLHEVDFAAAGRGDSPFFELVTSRTGSFGFGNRSRLFGVFRRRTDMPIVPTLPIGPLSPPQSPGLSSAPSVIPSAAGWGRHAFRFGMRLGRQIVPFSLRRRLAPLVLKMEEHIGGVDGGPGGPAAALADVLGLLPRSGFDHGPIVLCNNALAWGGVERQVVNTLRGLKDRLDLPLALLCLRLGCDSDHDFYLPALQALDIPIRNVLPAATARDIVRRFASTRMAQIQDAIRWLPPDVEEEVLRLTADFLTLRPRVVHAWQDSLSISAAYAARLAGVPRILVSGRNMIPQRFAYHRPYMRAAYQQIAACSNVKMLNNSVAGAADYASWLGLPVSRWQVIRNGVDARDFAPPDPASVAALRDMLLVPQDAPLVGSVFRFYPEKRPLLWVETALLIARQRPDCHFVVFGVGPLRDAFMERVKQAGIDNRMHLPGTTSDTNIALSAMDLFLLTSEMEGTPNVVLEASLLGVPVVVADAGGAREAVLAGSTGLVVDNATPLPLAEAVLNLLADNLQRREIKRRGPEFVSERFGLARMIEETMSAYADLREPEAALARGIK